MSKKTAVEWLVNELEKHHIKLDLKNTVVFIQAKAIEKEQIIDAYDYGFADGWDEGKYDDDARYAGAEQYYNETFTETKND